MLLPLVRVGGGSLVHVQEEPGKARCEDRAYAGKLSSWRGEASEITCVTCRLIVGR